MQKTSTPNAHTSRLAVTRKPSARLARHTSGAVYGMVPLTRFTRQPTRRVMPKSASLMRRHSRSNKSTFSGLTSRCTKFLLWMKSRARPSCCMQRFTISSGRPTWGEETSVGRWGELWLTLIRRSLRAAISVEQQTAQLKRSADDYFDGRN